VVPSAKRLTIALKVVESGVFFRMSAQTVIRLSSYTLAIATMACLGCTGESVQEFSDEVATIGGPDPTDVPNGDDTIDWFTERAEATGLRFTHLNGMSGEFFFPEMIPGGVGVLDYDNDGDLDVYLVQGRMLGNEVGLDQSLVEPDSAFKLGGRLFRNELQLTTGGPAFLRFTDVTEESGIETLEYGMGVASGDVDNDGCIDIYLTNFGPNKLLRNNCDGTFSDFSAESGTNDPGWGVSASFVDYDHDGWLDLYVGNYLQYQIEADRACTGLTGRRDYCTPDVYTPQADRLYRNQRNGHFVDVTSTALFGADYGPALGVSTADFNSDGWVDIYVTNDGSDNLLWMNQGDGTLSHVGLLSGVALSGDGTAEGSMGVDAADFDNDGDPDLFMTHLPAEGNNLYLNNGAGVFEDVSGRVGLGPLSLGRTGFGAAWLDVDNDGWLDLVAVNGAIEAIEGRLGETFPYGERNSLFLNLRNGRFDDVTNQAGAAFNLSEVSRGAAFGDLDNDGDTDIVVSNNSGPVRLFINEIGQRVHWLGLDLRQEGSRTAIGTRVEVTRSTEPAVWRRVRSDGSYASASDPRVLVGLGQSSELPAVRVFWPSGRVELWPDVEIDRYMTLIEGQGLEQ
jgi:hypothetical protein